MTADIAIVGGGVIGCGIAYELARRNAGRIVVFERGEPGNEASGAAAGVLAFASSRAPDGVLFQLKRAGALCFPQLTAALREESGIDVEYRPEGLVDLALSASEAHSLGRRVARRRSQGFAVDLLDRAGLRELEPQASEAAESAAIFYDDRSINNVRLVAALRIAAERRGVEFRTGCGVDAIEHANGMVAAVSAGSLRTGLGHLIIAGGAWSKAIGDWLRIKVPVRPDRGEMAALRPAYPLRHTLSWNDGYLVPRLDGEVLVGSTSTRNTWDRSVTAKSLALLLERAAKMAPGLRDAPLVRTWAGLRPMSTLRRPIIAHLPGFTNVTLATGHHRNGIVMAPITARLVAELLENGETSLSMKPFRYRAG